MSPVKGSGMMYASAVKLDDEKFGLVCSTETFKNQADLYFKTLYYTSPKINFND
ncbi:hypothetical protein N8648_05305 [Verrucomicrobia bacterium]|nr:hypothetical protein [Verrucomicrobiota bacterium]